MVLLIPLWSSFFLALLLKVNAQDIIVSPWDKSITYTSVVDDGYPTWGKDADTSKCHNPRQNTQRVGDTASFTFTGTTIGVTGTRGVFRGIEQVDLDGVTVQTFDRTYNTTQCDVLWFYAAGLTPTRHTIKLTLVSLQPDLFNPSTAPPIGIVSIQSFRYTPLPSKAGLIGGAVGGTLGVLLIAGLIVAYLFWRRKVIQSRGPVDLGDPEAYDEHEEQKYDSSIPTVGSRMSRPATVAIEGAIIEPFHWPSPNAHNRGSIHTDGGSGFEMSRSSLLPYSDGMSVTPDSSTGSRRDSKADKPLPETPSARSVMNQTPPNLSAPAGDEVWLDRLAARVAHHMHNPQDATLPMYAECTAEVHPERRKA